MEYFEICASYVRVGMWINGVLSQPKDIANAKKTAVLTMHSDADYLNFPSGKALAERGYTTLCANISRQQPLDKRLPDVKECIEFLKSLPHIETVVLLGHSGGATLMSAYQAVAENGAEVFQGPEKIIPCENLPPLPRADAVILIDSNWGNGAMTLLSLDPAVKADDNGLDINNGFDLSDPSNGYSPDGAHYSSEFIRAYQRAQGERNERLIAYALCRKKAIDSGNGRYRDDEPLVAAGGSQIAPNNRMFPQDTRLLSHTKGRWPLLHPDGSVTTEVVHSLRKARPAMGLTDSLCMGAMITTVKQYLSSNAVHTTEDFHYDETGIYGVDWDSCFCCTPGNVQHVCCPALVMGMTGGYEFLAAEEIFARLAAKDKALVFVEGANHMLFPAKECEDYPGQFGDTVKTIFDYAAKWLEERFS